MSTMFIATVKETDSHDQYQQKRMIPILIGLKKLLERTAKSFQANSSGSEVIMLPRGFECDIKLITTDENVKEFEVKVVYEDADGNEVKVDDA